MIHRCKICGLTEVKGSDDWCQPCLDELFDSRLTTSRFIQQKKGNGAQ